MRLKAGSSSWGETRPVCDTGVQWFDTRFSVSFPPLWKMYLVSGKQVKVILHGKNPSCVAFSFVLLCHCHRSTVSSKDHSGVASLLRSLRSGFFSFSFCLHEVAFSCRWLLPFTSNNIIFCWIRLETGSLLKIAYLGNLYVRIFIARLEKYEKTRSTDIRHLEFRDDFCFIISQRIDQTV